MCFILVYEFESLDVFEIISFAFHSMNLITGTHYRSLIYFAIYFSIMSSETSTEQAIKALQAQNAQFQELFMNLAKGQQDLKALILKEKKKKNKKKTVLFNMGRRFGNDL